MTKKSLKEFLPKLIFALFFVYVFILGAINLWIDRNKDSIESFLANTLEAQEVHIGNVSNLPFIFISGSEFTIIVNEELTLTIKDIYLQYRTYEIFTREFERVIRDIRIENVFFNGHTDEIALYQKTLSEKFSNVDPVESDKIFDILKKVYGKITIKRMNFTINSMTEFWNTIHINNFVVSLRNNTLYWDAHMKAHSIWSNQVFLAESSLYNRGTISNLKEPNGYINTTIQNLNLAGIPIVTTNINVNLNFMQGTSSLAIHDTSGNSQIEYSNEDGKHLSVKSRMNIRYNDFEEYNLVDYAFKQGNWLFDFRLSYINDWEFDLSFLSPQHPDHGLRLSLNPVTKNKLYTILLDLKTHYFGAVRADLFLPIRKGLYLLPGGSMHFDNTRFILNGLVFSGNIIADVVPNKNEIDASLLDVKMNGGLIGNTSAKFRFLSGGDFNIYPLKLVDSAVDITATIANNMKIDFKVNDLDGDFVAQNIRIPIFGIKDSRYKGNVKIRKTDRKDPLFLDGYLKGYLDGEEQIDAVFDLEDNHIHIPKFHILGPDILLSGDVVINSYFSNTFVNIDGQGSFESNTAMPIEVIVDLQKYRTTVSGTLDNQIPINTLTVENDTDFTLKFNNYSLQNFGWAGNVDAFLVMKFDEYGITRFSLQEGLWKVADRKIILDFDSLQNIETGLLDTTYFRLGMDQDVLDGYGHFSFLNDQFGFSFRFNRGGSLRFNMGRYIVKSQLNVVNFTVDNIFNFEIFDSLAILRGEETEVTTIQTDVSMVGTWDNLVYRGWVNIESEEGFQFVTRRFLVSTNLIEVKDLRLRHSQFNLDSDIISRPNKHDITGSFAYQNLVKSDFTIDYEITNDIGLLKYNLPNFYAMSKKPLNLKGTIFHDNQEYIFTSDHAKYGVAGTYLANTQGDSFWKISVLNESVRLFSEGLVNQREDLQASLDLEVFLNKLVPTGDLRRTKGTLNLHTDITGSLTDPIVDGRFDFTDIDLTFRSLRNRILMPNTQSIFISNNTISIPDITVNAKGGGTFGVDGVISYQNQEIETTDVRLYSKRPNSGEDYSLLSWKLDIPLVTARGKTYINDIHISGNLEELLLTADIQAENINLSLDLEESLGNMDSGVNPLLGMLENLNLDVNIDFINKTKFTSQIFSIDFEQVNPVKIEGGIDDVVIGGDFNIENGTLSYLNSSLKVSSGTINFSKEEGDPIPTIVINTETTKSYQNELLDISVTFEGKLPNLDLTSISSTPSINRTDLLNIISGAFIGETAAASTQDLLASGVGFAENTLFTNPLNRRIQQLIPFVDTFQIKTDILGNLTRSANEETGTIASGLDVFSGTEVEIGVYVPHIKGLQLAYNYKADTSDSSVLDATTLNHVHKVGANYTWNWDWFFNAQLGAGVNAQIEPNKPEDQVDFILDASVRKKF